MDNKSIVLRKVGGFYQVFDNDALIVNYLFNYKINNYRCGFPINVINKVINTLEEKSINYIIKGEEEIVKDYKRKNNYSKYLDKSISRSSINRRINNILDRISKMDENKLNDIIDIIEDYVYE